MDGTAETPKPGLSLRTKLFLLSGALAGASVLVFGFHFDDDGSLRLGADHANADTIYNPDGSVNQEFTGLDNQAELLQSQVAAERLELNRIHYALEHSGLDQNDPLWQRYYKLASAETDDYFRNHGKLPDLNILRFEFSNPKFRPTVEEAQDILRQLQAQHDARAADIAAFKQELITKGLMTAEPPKMNSRCDLTQRSVTGCGD